MALACATALINGYKIKNGFTEQRSFNYAYRDETEIANHINFIVKANPELFRILFGSENLSDNSRGNTQPREPCPRNLTEMCDPGCFALYGPNKMRRPHLKPAF